MKCLLISLLAFLCFAAVSGKTQSSHGDASKNLRFSHGSSDYEVVHFSEDWFAAKYYCKWSGMELASIETEEEHDAIMEATKDINEQLWISLNHLYKHKFFVWEATGDLAEIYTNWGAGQPEANINDLNYRCVYADIPSAERKWVLEDCYNLNKKKSYICEKPQDTC